AARPRVPERDRRREPRPGLLTQALPQLHHQDDPGVRHRVRVPDPLVLPADGGGRHPTDAAAGLALRRGGHRRARGGDHSERRPHHPHRALRADVPVLRDLDPVRAAVDPTAAQEGGRGRSGRMSRPAVKVEYDFPFDRFQLDAIAHLEAGRSVLVAAPTGSGKTVDAEHAVAEALAMGRRAFYTTPIKALSNKKFRDFVARHGADNVGLLTGDNSINGDAP